MVHAADIALWRIRIFLGLDVSFFAESLETFNLSAFNTEVDKKEVNAAWK